jgi:hypothetical protein
MPFAPRASTLCAPKAVAPIGNIGHDCAQSACTCSFSAVTAALAGAASSPRRAEHLLRKLLRALPKSRPLSPLSKPQHGYVANGTLPALSKYRSGPDPQPISLILVPWTIPMAVFRTLPLCVDSLPALPLFYRRHSWVRDRPVPLHWGIDHPNEFDAPASWPFAHFSTPLPLFNLLSSDT